MADSAVLLLQSPDRKGIVSAVSTFIYERNGNILNADEHQDRELGLYFLRIEWDLADFAVSLAESGRQFEPLAREYGMQWQLTRSSDRPKTAIFVSKSGHCLADLLFRHQIGELACDIKVVISNHDDLRKFTEFYGIPYHWVKVASGDKRGAEAQALGLLEQHGVELVVLARYMQVLSDSFVAR